MHIVLSLHYKRKIIIKPFFYMKKREPITTIMSSDIITVHTSQSLREVSDLIFEKNINHVPVVSGDNIIGMISKTDLQKISFVSSYDDNNHFTEMYDALKIEEVMTKDITSLQKDALVFDAAVILSGNEFHALPILDGNKVVGIVTSRDLLKYLVDQY